MTNKPQIFGEFFRGESKSRYDQKGFDDTANIDIHSTLGEAQCQLALTSESTTPNEACISAIDPNGITYFFSTTTGKIWKRTTDGTYSLYATNVNTAHRGARYFNGGMYFWNATDLGRTATATMTIANPCVVTCAGHGLADDDAITFNTTGALPTGITAGTTYYVNAIDANTFNIAAAADGANIETTGTQSGTHTMMMHSWNTLANGNGRGSAILNLSLFIADGNDISAVDNAGTFSQSALDLETNWIATDLCAVGTDLLIGTVNTTSNGNCKVFLWDSYSPSWSVEDDLPEVGVNFFMPLDNVTLAQCGSSGQFYYWTGAKMEKLKKVRGITTTNTAISHALTTSLNGKSLFANTTKIYSIHREDADMPIAVAHEYTSTGTVNSIIAAGSQLLASYTNGATIGVDKIGTNRATATLDTPEVMGNFQQVEVFYDSLPTGTSIGIGTKIDGAGSFTAQTPIVDSVKKKVSFDGSLGDVNFLQAQITLTPATSNTPKIKSIIFK